jgi:hypothetical protein
MEKHHESFNEVSSCNSDKREKKNRHEEIGNTIYSNFCEAFLNDKADIDKIRALISLEQDIGKVKDKKL